MDAPASHNAATASTNAAFEDAYWWSQDGIRLHCRDYSGHGPVRRIPIVCVHGLTRNARDFEDVAPRLAAKGHRVIAVDMRGRGDSGYAPDPLSYVPLTYAQDLTVLVDELALDRFVMIGTSMGAIVTMILAGMLPGRIAGAVINDIGPVIDQQGLDRIRGYVGQGGTWRTWVHAARAYADHADDSRFPKYKLADWLKHAKRAFRLTREGRIAADYDAKIAEPFNIPGGAVGGDMWPAFDTLRHVPVTIVRGEYSDILSANTATKMLGHLEHGRLITVKNVGHAPTLEEPEVVTAIDAMIDGIDTRKA